MIGGIVVIVAVAVAVAVEVEVEVAVDQEVGANIARQAHRVHVYRVIMDMAMIETEYVCICIIYHI